MLEFSYDFNLAVGTERIKLILDGWSYLISPTPCEDPKIQAVTDKLEVQTLLKALRNIVYGVICL